MDVLNKLSDKKDSDTFPTYEEHKNCVWRISELKNQLEIDKKKTDR
jgi:hypothetical protein